jgi:glutathione peroxidase
MASTFYDFSVNRIDGTKQDLKDYHGKTLLVVNVASKCGLTPQYEGLEKLYKEYKDQGLEVLGFPANEFLGQEPGTNEEIQSFCRANFGVDFPMFEKLVVKGEGQHPLYQFLTNARPQTTMRPDGTLLERLKSKNLLTGGENDIKWNFEKFLVNKSGEVVERFSPELDPLDPLITSALKKLLSA